MGCRILSEEHPEATVLYCSCIGVTFGPVFDSSAHAQSFLDWCGVDPRKLDAELLREAHLEWQRTHEEDDGKALRDVPLADDDSRSMLGRLQQAEHEFERRGRRRWNSLGATA